MNRGRALGKGIDALFGDIGLDARAGADETVVRELPVDEIDPNREQPRKRFDREEMERLAESIGSVGVIQPIAVFREGARYTIIAGERRWRAARIAGLKTIPALIRDYDRVRRVEVALIENLQREDLNPVEEATGIRHLIEECGLTQEDAGKRLGKSRPAITNLLRLLTLPESVLSMLRLGEIAAGHARALVSLPTAREQERLAADIAARGMSVRQAEEAARRALIRPKGGAGTGGKTAAMDESVAAVEEAARRVFATRVKVEGSAQKGKITIHYSSRDDLERIYAALGGGDL